MEAKSVVKCMRQSANKYERYAIQISLANSISHWSGWLPSYLSSNSLTTHMIPTHSGHLPLSGRYIQAITRTKTHTHTHIYTKKKPNESIHESYIFMLKRQSPLFNSSSVQVIQLSMSWFLKISLPYSLILSTILFDRRFLIVINVLIY